MKDILKNEIYKGDIKEVLSYLDLSPLNGKRLLITGAAGLICSSLIDLLLVYDQIHRAGIRIYAGCRNIDRFNARYGGYPSVRFYPYEAGNPFHFSPDVDYIIHGAGITSPELYLSKPVETMFTTIESTRGILERLKVCGKGRMLYISSSEVYGAIDAAEPIKEDEFGPIDLNSIRSSYSESKRAAELLCRSYLEEYGVDSVIVRPGHIYGPTASSKDKRISSEFAYLSAMGKDLEMKSPGLQRRSYCYCLDCASAILIALLKGEAGESYNIGSDEVLTIKEMASILAEAGEVGLICREPSEEELKRFNPMGNSSLDISKIKSLGHRSVFKAQEGLAHTVLILRDLLAAPQAASPSAE